MAYPKPKFKERYENFINGKFAAPVGGQYFDNTSPIDNSLIAKYPRSQKEDVDNAVAAANAAKDAWGNTSAAERAGMLNKVADIIEANLEEFALVETCDNGKPIRETLNADIPLAIDHWRYFAAVIRARHCNRIGCQHAFINHKRASRCCRSNYPLEFSVINVVLEIAAGTGSRKLCGTEARRTNTLYGNLIDGKDRRYFPSGSN